MNLKTGFWAFVFGGLTGAVVTLMVAPQSGEETRQLLVNNTQKIKEDALDSIQGVLEIVDTRLDDVQLSSSDDPQMLSREMETVISGYYQDGETTY